MKWVLYLSAGLVGLIGLCVIVLLVMGGGRGESRLVASVDTARPADVVFTWITEPERVKSWVGWLVEIKSMTPHTAGVGARAVWVMEDRNNNNQRMNINSEITRHEPGRLLEARLDAPAGFTGTIVYQLQPIDANRTRLTYTGDYKYEHWLAKLLEPAISRSAKHKLEEDVARLKQKAEAE
jgi:uncharacterized protein YndB with AHSA1/START domain